MISQCIDGVPCHDGSCANHTQYCPNTCPPQQPVACADGACKGHVTECLGALDRCNADDDYPVLCWDGTCAQSGLDCVERQYLASQSGTFSSETAFSGANVCPIASNTLCGDGSCIAQGESCELVQACPLAHPYRCSDGSCGLSSSDCTAIPACTYPSYPSPQREHQTKITLKPCTNTRMNRYFG